MLLQEFIERTSFYPTPDEYNRIESLYYTFSGDKDAFCKHWKKYYLEGASRRIVQTLSKKREEINRLNEKIYDLIEERNDLIEERRLLKEKLANVKKVCGNIKNNKAMKTYTYNELKDMVNNQVSLRTRGYVDGKLHDISVGYDPDVDEWGFWVFEIDKH